ncbi:MAG TPA: L-threonylcarbamoyladenylate synthase [Deltaproteobacteria bacterium]|jgi:L-threonylcarbamoyladenylate synthase|nr:L-threonylcarbamoyladenylate synthase [Deltaproteobacteria bacterium]HOI07769.1 L-threonylcarbamoyladenylate synthase [Deltaproteobacteria bacterium]
MLVTCDVAAVAAILNAKPGAVVAYPTETFYGLGARISDHDGIERIVSIKGRDASKGMIVLASSMEEVLSLAEVDLKQKALLAHFWPGPLSAVLRARPGLHPLLAPGGRVALRISPHPLALALTKAAGPVTSTSANPSGMPPAADAPTVAGSGLDIDAVLDGGRTPGGLPSTLMDLTTWPPACLREGAITSRLVVERSEDA